MLIAAKLPAAAMTAPVLAGTSRRASLRQPAAERDQRRLWPDHGAQAQGRQRRQDDVLTALDAGLGHPDTLPQDNGCFNLLEWRGDRWAVLKINELLPDPSSRPAS